MTDERLSRGGPVNPTLTAGPFVLPPAEDDLEAEARFARQLQAIDRAAQAPRARLARGIAFVWRWYANLCGAAVISGTLAGLAIWCFAGDEHVVLALSAPRPEIAAGCPDKGIACVRAGGQLAFVQDMQRLAACPGEVVEVFSRPPHPDGGNHAAVESVQQRRPAQSIAVTVFPDLRIVTQVPASLSPGRWAYSFSVDTRCPEREKVDPVAAFEIEVLP